MAWLNEAGTLSASSQDALDGLREARRLLRRPEAPALNACVPHLETAIRYLTALERRLRSAAPGSGGESQLRGEIEQVGREIEIVNALMENAGRFYAGLGQLLAAASQNVSYTAQGLIETEARRSRLRVAG